MTPQEMWNAYKHAYYCYKAVGFDDVILDTTETYCVLGEEWKCKELMVENV